MSRSPSLLGESDDFDKKRRQSILYKTYYENSVEDFEKRNWPELHELNISAAQGNPFALSQAYAMAAIDEYDFWQLRYTGGEEVLHLASKIEKVLYLFEQATRFQRESEGDPDHPGFDLAYLDHYVRYVGLLSLLILLHREDLILRLHHLLAGSIHDRNDALVEDLLSRYLAGRPYLSDSYHEEPYWHLLEVPAQATAEGKQADLRTYLGKWYRGMRPAGWYDSHRTMTDQGGGYFGYWSWEAGAIAYLHNIDDSTINSMYYPRDLVAYARSVAPAPVEGTAPATTARLRCNAGQACPRSGWWSTPALGHELRPFRQGDDMPEIDSNNWGLTMWYFDEANQSGPQGGQ